MNTLFIVHKFKIYHSDDQTYAWANVYESLLEAVRTVNNEIASDIDADAAEGDMGDVEVAQEIQKLIPAAWKEGEETEAHDAILHYGDFTAYYDITKVEKA